VIEAEYWEVIQVKESNGACVITGFHLLDGGDRFSRKDDREIVLPRVSLGVRVDVEEIDQADVQRCLFLGFSDRRIFDAFAIVHESAGQRPADRLVFALDQQDFPRDFDDDVHCGERVSKRHSDLVDTASGNTLPCARVQTQHGVRMEDSERYIILASGSPRRRELLEMLGFNVEVRAANIPEFPQEGERPEAYTARLSAEKARTVSQEISTSKWLLAADTVVVCEGEILEKPQDEDHAMEMLRALAGNWHSVFTSFCWLHKEIEHVETVKARVKMRTMGDDLIRSYVRTGEPMDKAGAYGVQGLGSSLVERIDGSYHAVVGLPVCEVLRALQELGGIKGFPFGATP